MASDAGQESPVACPAARHSRNGRVSSTGSPSRVSALISSTSLTSAGP
ncbi:hypothetical protein [Thermoactinospora rubra]|nr:hypothetical protein [Thermoactinospora rubra]